MTSNENEISQVYGLVLAGGKSSRLGEDKGKMVWHGKQQRYYMAVLLMHFCDHVFISCREDQSDEIVDDGYRIIEDAYAGLGPFGAILSAFKFKSNVAWFVVACDLPLLNIETLQKLMSQRDILKVATTYKSPHDGLPEPLITIWEPRSHKILLSRMEEGNTCPRKALLNTDTKIIDPDDSNSLLNMNTPKDMEQVKNIYGKRLEEI